MIVGSELRASSSASISSSVSSVGSPHSLIARSSNGLIACHSRRARSACAVRGAAPLQHPGRSFVSEYTNSTSAWCRNFGIGRLPPTHIDTTIGTMPCRRAISLSVKPQIRVASKAAGRRRTRSGKMVVSAGVAMP